MIVRQGLSTHDIHVAALNQANIQRQVQENQKLTAAISIFHRFQNLADSCGRAGYTIAYHVNNSFTDITFYCVWIPLILVRRI